MADINLRSQQAITGSMIARVKALTDINDVSPGSAILTILEAAASSDFLQEAKLLQLLNLRSLDKATGTDLENLAYESGIAPARHGSTPAHVYLTVSDTSFEKVASNIYAGATSPAAGDTKILIVDGTGFSPSGTLYINRGGQTYEAAAYVSIASTGSYWVVNLAAPLTKDHLVGEEVVQAQGGDRLIPAGTIVSADGQSGGAGVSFSTKYEAVLLDGENVISGILSTAQNPGRSSNVGRRKIGAFQGAPWSTAAVSNPDPAVGGRDPETDSELRQRIKDHFHSLSGGTERAIVRAVVGQSDDEENKRVVSAYLKKPTGPSDETVLYIDDGTGFAPSFSGIGEEVIITRAAGTESTIQLQKWPLVKAQVGSVLREPFSLFGGESFYVEVDGEFEERAIPSAGYRTPGVATAQEVAEAINKLFTSIEARAKEGQLFLTPVTVDPDYIRVGQSTLSTDANQILRFPTTKQFTIKLYRNDRLLEKSGSGAVIQSMPNFQWTGLTGTETLQFNIDGIDSPLVTLTDLDFATNTSSQTIAAATVLDWVAIINKKYIGVSAAARDDGTFTIRSNRGRTDEASISVISGTLAEKLFRANTTSLGRSPEFKLNRLLGQIELSQRMETGEELKAGNINTRGFALTNAQSTFALLLTGSKAPEMVIVADAAYTEVTVAQVGTVTFANPSPNVTRMTGATGQFGNVKADDWCHLYNLPRHGLLRVIAVGSNYVDFADPTPATGSGSLNGSSTEARFFRTEGLPQLLVLPAGSAVVSEDVVDAVRSQILGVKAEIMDSGAIRIQTTRFDGTGALAIPSVAGEALALGIFEGNYESNDPHTASVESAILGGIPSGRIVVSSLDGTNPKDNLNASASTFTAQDSNRAIQIYQGASSRYIRTPAERVSSTELALTPELPVQPEQIGKDSVATSLSGMEFGQGDNMVFLIDNQPANKTFDIPMYVDATVATPAVPSTTQMDLSDSTGELLGSSTRWAGHRFEDYRIWMKAKRDMPATAANSQLRMTSVPFGPNGERVRVGFTYPSSPDTEAQASFAIDAATDETQVSVQLASGSAKGINLQPNKFVALEVSGSQMSIAFLPPVDLSAVIPGDIVSINDSGFSSTNRGTMRVNSVSNLTDTGHAFEYLNPGVSDIVTITGLPAFTVAVGDRLTVGSTTYKITTVHSPTEYTLDTAYAFTGLQAGTISRIKITGYRYNMGSSETIQVASSQGVTAFELPAAQNKATTLVTLINGTAGVKDIVQASSAPGSTGAGSVLRSTEDELATGARYVSLQNGESFVYSTSGSSPAIRLKEPLVQAPEIGEQVRLIPSTTRNIADHFSRKQISGLTVAAEVALVDQGRRVQVSSKIPGGLGQVFAVGGRASGQNILAIRGTATEVNSSRAMIELDRSSIELLSPGHTIKISQSGRAKKKWPVIAPISSSTIEIEIPAVGQGKITTSDDLVEIYPYTQGVGGVVWSVRNIGRNRVRFEIRSGSATIPADLQSDDWALIGDGSAYAGITTDTPFAPANRGWFQIRETDNSTYFDVDGVGVEEFVSTTANTFIFTNYHSARPGDQLVIGYDVPVSTANKGTFEILSVNSPTSVTYANPKVEAQASLSLGSSGMSALSVLDQGYSTYRKVVMVAPKPSDPTNRSVVVVTPGYDLSLISEGQGAKVSLPNRLNYGTDPVPGVSGYSYWTGLKRRVQRVVDGYEADSATFPGVGAAGVSIEVREPQIQRIKLSMKVKTSKGVSLQALSDTIKSAIAGYVNSLGLGADVIMSEVIKIVQQIPGVDACVLVYPAAGTERVTVGDSSIARISTNDVTLS